MEILLEDIPHTDQPYPTVGNWMFDAYDEEAIRIQVSRMDDPRYVFLVGLHELVESYLCRKRGITEESVNAFDIEYERTRPEGNVDEPGDELDAPYHREHVFATKIERLMAQELGVDWQEYEKAVYALG